MSREKQIEEMAREIECARGNVENWYCRDTNCLDCTYKRCKNSYVAESLYNAGYRKQSEGEWVVAKTERAWNDAEYPYMHRCSLCGNEEASQSLTPYCPYCGAKMKSGAE